MDKKVIEAAEFQEIFQKEVIERICALEKRVKELERLNTNSLSQPKVIYSASISASPVEPKLYSGFTADEWKQMLKGGPLLCEVISKSGSGNVWIDRQIDNLFWGGSGLMHADCYYDVRLIEQPNWRPHMTDECPVPGRVKVFYATLDGSDSLLNSRRKEYGPMAAETINWANERIRAYRILGT